MLDDNKINANNIAQRFTLTLESYVKDTLYNDFTCSLKLDWSKTRRTSRGGLYCNGPGINIAMNSAALISLDGNTVYRFYEYPSYDSNSIIGGFYAKDYTIKLKAIIAHEVAHAVQFFAYKKLNIRCKPHGPLFKIHYSTFRELFINSLLSDQKAMFKEYNTGITSTSKRLYPSYSHITV
jgi:hypothetical protein